MFKILLQIKLLNMQLTRQNQVDINDYSCSLHQTMENFRSLSQSLKCYYFENPFSKGSFLTPLRQ